MKFDPSQISIIIACKNEGEGIARILKQVKNYAQEIIVVDGHSNDGTAELAKKFGAKFFLDNQKSRGDALKIGIKKAKGKVLVFFDADGSHEATDIPALVAPILTKKADLVLGSRRIGGSYDVNISPDGIIRSAGCDLLVYLLNRHFHTSLTDILYSFRAVRATTIRQLNLQSDDFGIEQEMVVSCLKKKLRVVEIPSREKARGWGKSKLHTLTGLHFIWLMFQSLYL